MRRRLIVSTDKGYVSGSIFHGAEAIAWLPLCLPLAIVSQS